MGYIEVTTLNNEFGIFVGSYGKYINKGTHLKRICIYYIKQKAKQSVL